MDKSVFKSKTFWFNLVMAILAMFPNVQAVVTPELFATIWGLGGVALRMITKDKVVLLP